MKFKFLLIAMFFTMSVVSAKSVPLSQSMNLVPLVENAKIQLPKLDKGRYINAVKTTESTNPKEMFLRPLQVSQTNEINKSTEQIGQWQSINGDSVWRLQLSAKDALHLNIGFKNLFLPESAKLFISNIKTAEVLAEYSSDDNKFHGELWTPLFDVKQLQIEINISSSEKDQLSLILKQAGQGIKAVNPKEYDTKSGDCNIDVVCPQGTGWENEIRSVARYTISDGSGTFLCTGTLINNTRGDREPLFLTAAHCDISDTTAASMVFYWNYETSVCAGTPDGSRDQKQNGASLVSRWEGLGGSSDFALVRLDEVPNASFNVYYAGWDNRDRVHTGTRAIHHPSGDEKRISVDNDALTITSYSNEVVDANANYFRIGEWDEGTTEGGSSGSGLWNLNHHLIGTLTGGAASCSAITASDWYGRFAKHWNGNGFGSNQLAPYLAPDTSAATTLGGVNNCSVPTVSISADTNTPSVSEQVNFTSQVSGGTAGYSYEWDFDSNGTVDSTATNPAHTFNSVSNNTVLLVVRDSIQCPGIARTMVFVADENETFLSDGLLPAGFSQTASTDGSWIVDDGQVSEGLFSLKSQVVNGGKTSSIELAGSYEAGNISFDRRVSSEVDYDYFKFFIDNIEQFSISGEQDWSNVSFPISAGSHVFRWSFIKDANVSKGQDAGWIDNLQFPAASSNNSPTIVTAIADQTNTEGNAVNLDISSNFTDPDGDTLSFSIANGPGSLTIDSGTGVISGTLMASDAAASPYTVNVTASDSDSSVTATFTWTVSTNNNPPTVVTAIADQTNTEGNAVNLDISSNFTDPDGDTLSFSIANGPGSLSIDSGTGVISGTLMASDAAASPYTVNVTVSDSISSVTATFTWTVNALPVTPSPAPAKSSGGGSVDLSIIGLLLLLIGAVSRRRV